MSTPLRREALVEVVERAAEIVRRAVLLPLAADTKGDGSPVTAIDHAIDAFLRQELGRLVPGAGWLSEETADDRSRLERDLTWIVDPIDGTKELLAGRDEIAISIGLVRGGRVVAAAVTNPLRSERGIWIEGAPPAFEGLTRRPDPPTLAEAEALVSRTEAERGDHAQLAGIVGRTRAVGSAAYKLLRVAAGADDLTYSLQPKHEWDLCGGGGLVQAAGRVLLRLDGVAIAFNRPDPWIPVGAVAGPRELAEAARNELTRRIDSERPRR